MIENGSFEEGWTDIVVPGSHTKNQIANSWELSWVTIGDDVWGYTRNENGTRVPLTATGVKEVRVIPEQLLPPNERHDGDDPLVIDGTHTYKFFHMGAVSGTQLKQTIRNLEPGARIELSIPIRVHLHDTWNEPDDVFVEISLNGIKVVFQADQLGNREWNTISITGNVDSNEEAVVVIRFITAWEHPRDFFIDDIQLNYEENQCTEPRIQYNRKYNVIPAIATEDQAVAIFLDGWRDGHQTSGGSYDDAGLDGGLENRTAILHGIPLSEQPIYSDWYNTHYPGTQITFVDLPSTADFDFTHYPLLNVDRVVTQPWGARPWYYQEWGLPGHEGIDLRANNGTKVVSVADGVVYRVENNPDSGNYGIHVRIQHVQGYKTIYSHLQSTTINVGDSVKGGDILGLSNNTGKSDGPHLHIALKQEGVTYQDQYGTWPYNFTDPTRYMEKFFDNPNPVSDPALGLHLRADPTDLSEGEYEEVDTLTLANTPQIVKLLHNHPATVYNRIKSIVGTNATIIVRVFQSWGNRPVTPQEFYQWNIDELTQKLSLLSGLRVFVELHNEPNLSQEGWGFSWSNGVEFGNWITETLNLFKQALPDSKFIYPGLSPGGNITGVRYDSDQFLNESLSALNNFDGVATHAYWSDPFPMQQALDYVQSVRYKTNKVIFVTEASRNDRPATRTPAEYGQDYVDFLLGLRRISKIGGVTYYVGSASDPVFEPETWVTESGERKGIAATIVNLL